MRADPPYGDILLQYREEDFGRVRVPGFRVIVEEDEYLSREFEELSEVFAYLTKLHDQRLKGTK